MNNIDKSNLDNPKLTMNALTVICDIKFIDGKGKRIPLKINTPLEIIGLRK
jgi:hypothetical protein